MVTLLAVVSHRLGTIQVVRHDRSMEQIVFPIPEICEYLTEETKRKTYLTAERDDQGSKVADFFAKSEDMFTEIIGDTKPNKRKVGSVEATSKDEPTLKKEKTDKKEVADIVDDWLNGDSSKPAKKKKKVKAKSYLDDL